MAVALVSYCLPGVSGGGLGLPSGNLRPCRISFRTFRPEGGKPISKKPTHPQQSPAQSVESGSDSWLRIRPHMPQMRLRRSAATSGLITPTRSIHAIPPGFRAISKTSSSESSSMFQSSPASGRSSPNRRNAGAAGSSLNHQAPSRPGAEWLPTDRSLLTPRRHQRARSSQTPDGHPRGASLPSRAGRAFSVRQELTSGFYVCQKRRAGARLLPLASALTATVHERNDHG